MSPTIQNQRFICGGNADPVDDDLACRAAITAASWWVRADIPERWPVSTEVAAELLTTAGEFDIDVDGLADLIDRRLLPRPPVGEAEELEWSASDIVAAGGLLEMRNQWKTTPSGHDAKKHPCQLLLEQARQNDELELITVGNALAPRFDVRHLLALLVASDVHEGRVKLATLLKAVLEVDHGVLVR